MLRTSQYTLALVFVHLFPLLALVIGAAMCVGGACSLLLTTRIS